MMFWEGLTAISAQKHFQIKFINIAINCNTFFDIAIYRNTFLGPQYPALLLAPCETTLTLSITFLPLKIRLHIFHVFIYEMNFNLCVLLVYNESVQTLCITRVISHNDEHVVENKVLSLINRFVCYFIK